jgi:hypothetical protein
MFTKLTRHLLWRRRLRAAHTWRDAERRAYQAAKGRIIALAPTTPDPAGRRAREERPFRVIETER